MRCKACDQMFNSYFKNDVQQWEDLCHKCRLYSHQETDFFNVDWDRWQSFFLGQRHNKGDE